MNFLNDLGLETSTIMIERAHRLGAKSDRFQPRPIIVKFLSYKNREAVLQAFYKKRKDSPQDMKYVVCEDFPQEIERRRKILWPYFQVARHQKNTVTRFTVDNLWINHKRFTLENLDDIPAKFKPTGTRSTDHVVALFTSDSPLSNFYPCEFTADGTKYCCVEQYVTHKKAEMFGDSEAEEEIMQTKVPGRMKARARSIKHYDAKRWNAEKGRIMMDALTHKFTQNTRLKGELAATRGKRLVEANPRDKYWGGGVSLHDPRIDSESWPGHNKLGLLLEQLRADICG